MLNKKETLLSSEQKGDYCQRLYLKKTKATFCLGHGFLSSLAKVPFSHQCCARYHQDSRLARSDGTRGRTGVSYVSYWYYPGRLRGDRERNERIDDCICITMTTMVGGRERLRSLRYIIAATYCYFDIST